MAVQDEVTAQAIGRYFAEVIREEPAVARLWVSADRDQFKLWLLTAPIPPDVERSLHALSIALDDQFVASEIQLHVLNPEHYDGQDATASVPVGAEEIPLRPA